MRKITFSDVAPHLIAVLVFFVVTVLFFSPIFFENKSLDQQDIQQHLGSSKLLRDFREKTGEEGLWAPSMFSGMPAYLVNLQWSDGVLVTIKKTMTLFLPSPVRNIYAAFICYYIMLLAFRVRPYLAMAGALAFGLSSYIIIGLAAGHNARIGAIALAPLVMAGIHLTFTKNRILGFGVTALALAMQLRESHIQITYYLAIIVAIYGLIQFIYAWRERLLNDYFKSLGILIPAAVIAAATYFGQFWAVTEYSHYSIRGPSELTGFHQNQQGDGLTKEYAFAYNYGLYEPMTLLIPEFYGGSSMKAFVQDENSASYKALSQSNDNQLANQLVSFTSAYWGPQSGTAGPYYAGAIVVFLFVVGILFAEKKYVWWLVSASIIGIMLAWGDSFKAFNYFVFDHLPGYNKFRSFSFALFMILMAMPLLGMMGLEKLLSGELEKRAKSKLLIAASATAGLCLLFVLFASMGSYTREGDSQLPGWFLQALRADRMSLLRADAFRSFIFITILFGVLFFNLPKKVSLPGFYALLVLLVIIDLIVVDKRYFTKENFHRKNTIPFEAMESDNEILKDKSYYRVYNLQEPWSMGARTAYFHHSLSGYHGAKMRRYQDLYDSCLSRDIQEMITDAQSGQLDFRKYGVLNMLNTKYIQFGPKANNIIPNDRANGPAWFVNEVVAVNTANDELKKTGEVDTRTTAVINTRQFAVNTKELHSDSLASITLVEQKPYWLKYESQSATDGIAVFSEIYYPKGWRAIIDGQEVPILRTDYVLRALEVPSGKHVIEFKFEPAPYITGNKITLASSWLLLLIVAGCIANSLREEKAAA